MTSRTGGCLCGAVRYELTAEPAVQAVCHCKNCQKQAGTAFSMIIGVPESAMSVTGTPTTYIDHGESGNEVRREFCGKCGSPLFSRVATASGMIFVKAGTLDDTTGFKPAVQVWAKSRQDWFDLGSIPAFETNPG